MRPQQPLVGETDPRGRGGGSDRPAAGAFLRRRGPRCVSSSGTGRRSGRRRGTRCRCAHPMPCGACSGHPASSGWPGLSSWVTSPSKATSSRLLAALHRASPGAHPRRLPAAVAGDASSASSRGHGQAPAAAAGGGCAARPPALAQPRCTGRAASLRRQQRLLRHGPRARHDVLLRTIRARESRRSRPPRNRSTTWSAASSDWPMGQGSGSSTSGVAGAPSPCMRPGTTARRCSASRSVRPRPDGPATGSPPPDWTTRLRSGCRTTGTSATGHSTASRRSACSSTSARRRARSTSPPCGGCSGRRAACSTTPSRAWAGRASARGPSSGATCSPTASSSTWARSSCRWRRRGSRCATSSPSASTTPKPSEPGWPTSSDTGTRPWPRWECGGPVCGSSTWRRRPTGSKTAGSPSIRCWASCRGRMAGAACPRRARLGLNVGPEGAGRTRIPPVR